MKTFQFQYQAKKGWINRPDPKTTDSEKTLILAFCAPVFRDNPEVLSELKSAFPKSKVVGCSTSGEIFGSEVFDFSISCTAICFEDAHLKIAFTSLQSSSQSFEVGKNLAQSLKAPDLKGIIILSDGLAANGSALAEGVNSQIDTSQTSVSGGLAGDGSKFESTWIFNDEKICSQSALAIGLYGANLFISSASKGGWDIFGPERLVTRSTDNVVYEIDGRPALDLYKEYLGDKAKDLPASGLLFPIQIRANSNVEKRLVRTILSVNEESKALNFAGNVPQGYLVQLMRANFDRVIDGASDAADVVKKRLTTEFGAEALETNSVCLAISCVGRRLVLGARSEEEIEALAIGLGKNTAVIGFYSYGELAPSIQGSPCDLHNQSMTLMNIYEASASKRVRVA